MNKAASGRSPLKFFILALVLSIPFLLAGSLVDQALPFGLPISALMFPCPFLAAVILVYREEGRGGARRFLGRLLDAKVIRPKRWFVPIFLLTPAIYLLAYVVMFLLGLPLASPLSVLFVPLLFLIFFVAAAGEEAGWTNYATDPMQTRYGALGAALLIGVIWAAWHVIPDLQAHQSWAFIVGQRTFTVFLRVLMVWIYNNAGKSVFSAIIVHDMVNVSVYTLFPEVSYVVVNITAVIAALLAVVVVYLWGPRTLSKFRFGKTAIE